jgi:hypothetical protein
MIASERSMCNIQNFYFYFFYYFIIIIIISIQYGEGVRRIHTELLLDHNNFFIYLFIFMSTQEFELSTFTS